MKVLFGLLLFLLNNVVFCQNLPIDSVSKKIRYVGVVKMDSIKKENLYSKINEWFAKSYNSATDVIQLNSREDGKIIGKAVFSETLVFNYNKRKMPIDFKIPYTISVSIKDGRFKYDITNFLVSTSGVNYPLEVYNLENKNLNYAYEKAYKNKKVREKRINELRAFYNRIYSMVDSKTKSIIANLLSEMKKEPDDDW